MNKRKIKRRTEKDDGTINNFTSKEDKFQVKSNQDKPSLCTTRPHWILRYTTNFFSVRLLLRPTIDRLRDFLAELPAEEGGHTIPVNRKYT